MSRREACSGCQCCMDLGQGWSCHVMLLIPCHYCQAQVQPFVMLHLHSHYCQAEVQHLVMLLLRCHYCQAQVQHHVMLHLCSHYCQASPTSCDAAHMLSLVSSSDPTPCFKLESCDAYEHTQQLSHCNYYTRVLLLLVLAYDYVRKL